jgi:hypothetical protein
MSAYWAEDLRYTFEVRARIGTGDTGRYRAVQLVPSLSCHALWILLLFLYTADVRTASSSRGRTGHERRAPPSGTASEHPFWPRLAAELANELPCKV